MRKIPQNATFSDGHWDLFVNFLSKLKHFEENNLGDLRRFVN